MTETLCSSYLSILVVCSPSIHDQAYRFTLQFIMAGHLWVFSFVSYDYYRHDYACLFLFHKPLWTGCSSGVINI